MSKSRKSPARFVWNSACTTCKALFQWCYSALVLLLVATTLFAAYVATLDDIPVPQFLIRELQNQIKSKGIALRMEGVRFQPNGRITFEQPELYSPELGSTIIAAQRATAKLKLSHLAFGSLAIDEIQISSARFILPAMLTPSGQPTTAISSISLHATHRFNRWTIHYANCAIGDLKLSLAGRIDDTLLRLPPPNPDAPKPNITQAILKIAPQITRLQKELERLDSPFCTVDLDVENKKQKARLHFGARQLDITPEIKIHDLLLQASYTLDSQLNLTLDTRQVELPQAITLGQLHLDAQWQTPPTPAAYLPDQIQLSATNLTYQEITLPTLIAHAHPGRETHQATLQIPLPLRPLTAHIQHQLSSKETNIELTAQLDPATIALLDPIIQKLAGENPVSMQPQSSTADIHLQARFDSTFKPIHAQARAQAGPTTIRGASVDYAAVTATVDGPQIDISKIRLFTGQQYADLRIGFNLDTLLRRVLVEGSVDPTIINGWFKPWWSGMWAGMVFPQEGLLAYLDSQGTFKRPESIRVTGSAYGQNIDVRGLPVRELRTRIFARFHYVDLYDIQLTAQNSQSAYGSVQFHMDRDTRDEKDKLTGIWIDAISTLDVKNAPSLIWEIAEDATRILLPYCYEIPPLIEARSSSIRHLDQYQNDIDLQIEADSKFTFYGYPFDSLQAQVHIGDDIIDIPTARGGLGGGHLQTSAFIIGDTLQVDAQIQSANFGQTLVATNTYFANDGSESSQNMDLDRLLNFGGTLNAHFQGQGILSDTLSYLGTGAFDIAGADFGELRMLGLLSMALEITPLRFTTLKFTKATSPFTVDRDTVNLTKIKVEGPVATIQADGNYNIKTDALDFAAKLFPFRNSKLPLISPIINLPLNIFSNVLEVHVGGTFEVPEMSLFNPSTKEAIKVSDPRSSRPNRR